MNKFIKNTIKSGSYINKI